MLKRLAKPSDLNQELATWSDQDVIFIVTESMVQKFKSTFYDAFESSCSPGGHLHVVLAYSTYEDVASSLASVILPRGMHIKIVFILPSFSDFRHFSLLQYTESLHFKDVPSYLNKEVVRWGKIARFIKPEWQVHQILAISAAMDAFSPQWGMEFRNRHILLKYNLNTCDHDYVSSRNPDLVTGLSLRVVQNDDLFRYSELRSTLEGRKV